jgi:GT2 family glycosyltransferase
MKSNSLTLGVVIVTYNSADVIRDCLETLFAGAGDVTLSVVVVDNASPDMTVEVIEAWSTGEDGYSLPGDLPFNTAQVLKPVRRAPAGDGSSTLHLIKSGVNGGFAAGVNIGLAYLAKDSEIDRFWILNPDCVVPAGTPTAFARHDEGHFSLMGGRITYYDQPDMVQMDGGTLNRWTGVTGNVNLYAAISETDSPRSDEIDFISGACMVASREFYEVAGPMCEDYFLYYEEVDWALHRGDLPLILCAEARVYHRAGTSIGSPAPGRIASPFSLYFKHRARMRFVRKHLPKSVLSAWAYTLAKATQYFLKGWMPEARAILNGALEGSPSAEIRAQPPMAATNQGRK